MFIMIIWCLFKVAFLNGEVLFQDETFINQIITHKHELQSNQNYYKIIDNSYSDDDIVVGFPAVDQAEHNPANTIYDAKRFIGKHFDKKELEVERARYPFKVGQMVISCLLKYTCPIIPTFKLEILGKFYSQGMISSDILPLPTGAETV